jgi:adenylylsulfate kinase-like enzyme
LTVQIASGRLTGGAVEECRAMAKAPFIVVHVAAPLAVTETRDVRGLYAKARAGQIPHFTGISDPYEPPLQPELVVETGSEPVEASGAKVLAYLEGRGLLPRR